MKYLVLTQLESGLQNAVIFDSMTEAEAHLTVIASHFESRIRWNGDYEFHAEIGNGDWIKVQIIKANRAEYRLVRHALKEKDEERRFSVRENAIKFVGDNYDASESENNLGEWIKGSKNAFTYKLYAVILDSESGSKKVIKRINATDSQHFIFSGSEELPNREQANREKNCKDGTITQKKEASPFFTHFLSKKHFGKKKIAFIIAVVTLVTAIGINHLVTDWQLVADERKANSFSASEEVKTIAEALSFTRKGRAVFFASQPKLLGSMEFNKTCGRDGSSTFTSGCYYPDQNDDEHIEIYDVGTSIVNENGVKFNFAEYRKSVALHEMLHAVWEKRLSEKTKELLCGDLKTLSSQISGLEEEVKAYSDNQLCSELFARVGSEYIQILSPNNTIPSSANVPVQYYSLDLNGRYAVKNLAKVYSEYFDLTKFSWVIAYWESMQQLDTFETKVMDCYKRLLELERYANNLKNQYYSWPTRARFNNANSAISEYNRTLETLKSYVNTYNKIISKLDSEHTLTIGNYLSL